MLKKETCLFIVSIFSLNFWASLSEKILPTLSVKEKIGQLFIAAVPNDQLP
jgi:hypothetical protein